MLYYLGRVLGHIDGTNGNTHTHTQTHAHARMHIDRYRVERSDEGRRRAGGDGDSNTRLLAFAGRRPVEAIEQLQKCVELNPLNVKCWLCLLR